MALVLVMILAALIALFIAATGGGAGGARICRLAMRPPIVEAAEGFRRFRGAAAEQLAPARESAGPADPAGQRRGRRVAGWPVALSTSATRRAFCKSGIRDAARQPQQQSDDYDSRALVC